MRNVYTVLVGLVMMMISAATLSHHSFSAEFDVGRPVAITGAVTRVEWTNPHAWIHLAVEDEQGNVQQWAVEMLGVNTLVRSGMTPQTVKAGDVLTITGYGSRDGTNAANASSVTRTETGESLWASAGN
jgi:DNA/RNA endonuclease YhcR with UshA esterase domain